MEILPLGGFRHGESGPVCMHVPGALVLMQLQAFMLDRHKGAGAEAVKLANSYAIRAEIKMGEMLKATERAPAGRPSKEIGDQTLPISPTLAELGVTKRESSEAHRHSIC
jgi:hypothetical protein